MLLMHFDGDFVNESAASADGVAAGDYLFITNSADGTLGNSLFLNNDAPGDSSHVTVADTAGLDMIGDWTIEGWINVSSFGTEPNAWRWVPRLIIKPGDEAFWRPNYWIEFWGDNRFFSFGYHNVENSQWPQANTPNNFVETGVWYHTVFLRDTTSHVLINMISDASRNIIHFSAASYDAVLAQPPLVNSQPVHIGWAGSLGTTGGASGDSWLDGFVDEIRVSNMVRDFDLPPAIVSVTDVGNQTVAGPYPVSADVYKIGFTGTVGSVDLMYSVDGGAWQTVAMIATGDNYAAAIPDQADGVEVDYYITATDGGTLTATVPSNAVADEAYFHFNTSEAIGGPYTTDAGTMLLMHFDGDATNASTSSTDGVAHGTITYSAGADGTLGQSAFLKNDALGDSSHFTVADDANLDLVGDWTIEGWLNVLTFGTDPTGWRWVPRLIIKPGDDVFWRPNYWIEFWGDNRFFSFGYHNVANSRWPQVNTANNFVETGTWYHTTFIRDTTNHVLINMILDGDRNLIHFATTEIDAVLDEPPLVNAQPVHIGWAGSLGSAGGPSGDSWLDGAVDEVRISNVVRAFNMPPVILADTNITGLDTLLASTSAFEFAAKVFKTGAPGSITSASVMYTTDDGTTWSSVALTEGTGTAYTGAIPSQADGATVKFYLTATDDGGLVSTVPSGALSDSVYFRYAVPQGLVSIDPTRNLTPVLFELSQNYPNPFNPTTTIEFSISRSEVIKIEVFDLLGREVKTLLSGMVTAGKHRVIWQGVDNSDAQVASGVYIYRLTVADQKVVRRMVLLR